MAKLDTNALFTQYLNVVNRSIGEHREAFPWKQLLDLGDRVVGDKEIDVAIYKEDSGSPHHHATISFNGETFDLEHQGSPEGDALVWKVAEDHLRKVVEEPGPYVDNPARLDLDWLRSRIETI